MKIALRYIPAEVWVDVFIYPWISRKQLGQIVHRFKNRRFVEILQYCLHERGKRMLGTIRLDKVLLNFEYKVNIMSLGSNYPTNTNA